MTMSAENYVSPPDPLSVGCALVLADAAILRELNTALEILERINGQSIHNGTGHILGLAEKIVGKMIEIATNKPAVIASSPA